jgi:predicted acyltransferase
MTTSETPAAGRVVSMDQFRGYTVAGMIVVNFVGGLQAVHAIMKHHNTYFSYADTIMPSFMFAAGFSYRLTMLRRLPKVGAPRAYGRVFVRGLALVLISLMMYGFGDKFSSWKQVNPDSVREFVAKLIKADLWEVLAIIGVAQIVLMPVIGLGTRGRALAFAGFLLVHLAISDSFNFRFVHGMPNWMDQYWGAAKARCWDGGVFGILAWGAMMLGGTLAYDIVAADGPGRAARRLLAWGIGLMVVAYALSCLTRLYDVEPGGTSETRDEVAASPVRPPFAKLANRPFSSLLAEPPFVEPPPPSVRKHNYWMMNKRVVTITFTLFATGFASALYAFFILACDIGGLRLGVFRTFGQNPLAAYVIHHSVEESLLSLVPPDSPLWWCLVGIAVFFGINYLFIRSLERNQIFIRL